MPKLPAFEEWQAPWEKNGTEFNPETAKRLIYNLEAKVEERIGLPDRIATLETELETERTAREAAQTRARELEDSSAKDDAERQRLADERFRQEMRDSIRALQEGKPLPGATPPPAAPAGGSATTVTDNDRELALLRAGVPADQVAAHVKRVSGDTLDALTEDAKTYAATLGFGSDEQGGEVRYDGGSGAGEMPSDVPSRGGFRTDLGGARGGGRVNPAELRDLIPR